MKNTITYYEVGHGNVIIGKGATYAFDTEKEALDMVIEFKNNPRSHNPLMEDKNVLYWSKETYTVIKKTVTTETLHTI